MEKMIIKPSASEDVSSKFKKFAAPIEAEYKQVITRGEDTLTGYRGQLAIDRLNNIFGQDGWTTSEELLKEEMIGGSWAIAIKVNLMIFDGANGVINRNGYGAAYAKRIEDAYGAAFTTGLKRAVRQLGLGSELYYGDSEEIEVVEETKKEQPVAISTEVPKELEEMVAKIKKAESEEQLRSLEIKIKSLPAASQKTCLNIFNKKLIDLSKQ